MFYLSQWVEEWPPLVVTITDQYGSVCVFVTVQCTMYDGKSFTIEIFCRKLLFLTLWEERVFREARDL